MRIESWRGWLTHLRPDRRPGRGHGGVESGRNPNEPGHCHHRHEYRFRANRLPSPVFWPLPPQPRTSHSGWGLAAMPRPADFESAEWPKELAQAWKVTIGDGVATPALVGDKLFTFSGKTARVPRSSVVLMRRPARKSWSDRYEVVGADGQAQGLFRPAEFPGGVRR